MNNFFDVKILNNNNEITNPMIARYPTSGINHIPIIVTIIAETKSKNFSTMNSGAVLVLGMLNFSFKICDLKSSPILPGVIPNAPPTKNI